MTQVKDMTDQQLNRELTELQGYSVKISSVSPRWYSMINPQGREFGVIQMSEDLVWNEYAFPYCTDPAASLEVQTKAIEVDAQGYLYNLATVVNGYEAADIWEDDEIISMLKATPRERAEAANITLSSKH
ncbi:MAG TPA: hypothetical protein DEA91_10030 [Paenibacillus sp.]|nr:hypothetical protein [Paenibacillus sp.]